jgi:hypothetical protein
MCCACTLNCVVPLSWFVMAKDGQSYGPFIVRFVNCVHLWGWVTSRQIPILTMKVLKCISPQNLAWISWHAVCDVIRRPSMFDLIFLHSIYMDAFYKSFDAALSVSPSVSNGPWSGCQNMNIGLQRKRYVRTTLFMCFLNLSFTKRPLCGATVMIQNWYRAYIAISFLIFMNPCIAVWLRRNNQQDATL